MDNQPSQVNQNQREERKNQNPREELQSKVDAINLIQDHDFLLSKNEFLKKHMQIE